MPRSTVTRERMDQINSQLIQAGSIGLLKGLLVGLVSGYYFNYRYNHGHNQRFFKTPYKIWYLVSWGVVGITFSAEIAKLRIAQSLAEEEDIRRGEFLIASSYS